MPRRTRLLVAYCATLLAFGTMLFLKPIPQPAGYTEFADKREFFGVPNFLDVVSNAPFLIVGIAGLMLIFTRIRFQERAERLCCIILFFGLILTGFGSGYFHLAPDDRRLLWDRLPMALVFMSFMCATVAERISARSGMFLLFPLAALGIFSVVYWNSADDLRIYIVVQYFPLLAIPLIMALFPSRYTRGADFFIVVALYGVAKIFEVLDARVLAMTGFVSGHTMKHLAAAFAAHWILRMLLLRKRSL